MVCEKEELDFKRSIHFNDISLSFLKKENCTVKRIYIPLIAQILTNTFKNLYVKYIVNSFTFSRCSFNKYEYMIDYADLNTLF